MTRRRAILAAGVMILFASVAAQALDLYDEPRTIVETMLARYADGPPPDLMTLPFVPRIRMALKRTDIAIDPVINAEETRLGEIRVAATRMVDDKRATVEARFTTRGKAQTALVMFDRTSGDWLITDIRHANGVTLRGLLQIPEPR